MSDEIGPLHYSTKEEHVFMGRELGKAREHSEETQVAIDAEVRRIVTEQKALARRLIEENIDILHRLAKALLEEETLNAEQIEKIIKGEDYTSGPGGGSDGGGSPDKDSSDSETKEKTDESGNVSLVA